jgi:hypothetical protein
MLVIAMTTRCIERTEAPGLAESRAAAVMSAGPVFWLLSFGYY